MKNKKIQLSTLFLAFALGGAIFMQSNSFAQNQNKLTQIGVIGIDCEAGETRNAVVYDGDNTKCEYHHNRCCCPNDF